MTTMKSFKNPAVYNHQQLVFVHIENEFYDDKVQLFFQQEHDMDHVYLA